MEIKYIITKRYYNSKVSFFHLIFEWENIIKEAFHARFIFDTEIKTLYTLFGALYKYIPLGTQKPSFIFEMTPWRMSDKRNRPNIIPCIIDFYLSTSSDLELFYKQYKNHKLVLISSLEAYFFLKRKNCPLRIGHLALSISDIHRISASTKFDKQFDVLILGRINPVLKEWIDRYAKKRPEITVVTCQKENGHYNYYTQHHTFVGNADSREGYIDLMRKSRIGLYSTKGMDYDFEDANGFSQVTPRFLEYIATGNHIIARYFKNADTDYYEMERICPNTESYSEFEARIEWALKHPVDMKIYSDYLENHYTSKRVELLKEMIKDI